MTAQVSDSVRYEGGDYALTAVAGHGLFDPAEYGLETVPTTTANWRGYVAHYDVRDGRLLLAALTDVGIAQSLEVDAPARTAPVIAGVAPTQERYTATYSDMGLPMPFSGGLLIASGFIWDLYVHMGFHPAWRFERVVELGFEQGTLLEALDRSADAERMRREIGSGARQDPDGTPGDTAWIARTFSRDYQRSLGD